MLARFGNEQLAVSKVKPMQMIFPKFGLKALKGWIELYTHLCLIPNGLHLFYWHLLNSKHESSVYRFGQTNVGSLAKYSGKRIFHPKKLFFPQLTAI